MVDRLVSKRKPEWDRLENLLSPGKGKGIVALSAEEIMDLGYLYRRAVADLAIARRDFPHDRVCLYLNQLVARAHAIVYRQDAAEWRGIIAFFRYDFPILFRETLPFTAAAFLVFMLTGIVGFFSVLIFPDSASFLVPDTVYSAVKEQRMWTDDIPLPSGVLASLIMTNNIRVALLAFAAGALFGVPTFLVVAYNGLNLGAVAGICQAYGLSLSLWSFVAPHGIIELTVIFICGGAGLRLGYSLLHPGLQTRRESLLLATHQVVRLLFGCVPLLVIAGTIEGFISPSDLPAPAKLAFGVIDGTLLYLYLFFAGRRKGLNGNPT